MQSSLDARLNHPVLARAVTGARHVALEYKRRLDFVELLEQPLVLEKTERAR